MAPYIYDRGQRVVGGRDVQSSTISGSAAAPSSFAPIRSTGRNLAPGFAGTLSEALQFYDPIRAAPQPSAPEEYKATVAPPRETGGTSSSDLNERVRPVDRFDLSTPQGLADAYREYEQNQQVFNNPYARNLPVVGTFVRAAEALQNNFRAPQLAEAQRNLSNSDYGSFNAERAPAQSDADMRQKELEGAAPNGRTAPSQQAEPNARGGIAEGSSVGGYGGAANGRSGFEGSPEMGGRSPGGTERAAPGLRDAPAGKDLSSRAETEAREGVQADRAGGFDKPDRGGGAAEGGGANDRGGDFERESVAGGMGGFRMGGMPKPRYADGGMTPGMPSQPHEATLHGGEYVMTPEATAAIGPSNLQAINRAATGRPEADDRQSAVAPMTIHDAPTIVALILQEPELQPYIFRALPPEVQSAVFQQLKQQSQGGGGILATAMGAM